MAVDRVFLCEECTEEFVVAGSLYAQTDWVLRCPCCGSTDLLSLEDAVLKPAAEAAA